MSSSLEELKVGDVEIDRTVQRTGLEVHKLEKMKREWKDSAEGYYTVSRRKSGQQVLLDGAHRWTVKKELTDNQGTIMARVFEGLTKAEEAEIFLALNNTTQPMAIDKFRVRIVAGEPMAVGIDEAIRAYGWVIARNRSNGTINAIATLERLWKVSIKEDLDPNLLSLTILVITRAWGMTHEGTSAVILDGLGRFLAEYRDQVDIASLIERLRDYKGGPGLLASEAATMANLRKGKVSTSAAEIITEVYNKSRKSKALPRWSRR